MRAPGRTQAALFNTPHYPARWFRFALLTVCVAVCSGWLFGQSSQPAQSTTNTQQGGSAQQAPPSQQQQPMVMGESPDSEDDSGNAPSSAPAQPTAPASTQTPNKPAAIQPAPWNPATQTPEDAGARSAPPPASQPAQPPPSAALAVASPAPEPPIHVADAGGDQARQQINNACADMLKMANELKTEVDKTTKDMLSISVIRKANQIEQLAHQVRDEMRPEVGKN